MCGRYTLAAPDPTALRGRFAVGESVAIRRRYNVAPGDDVLAVITDGDGRPRGELLHWGLVPEWARRAHHAPVNMINARLETVTERAAFRGAFERRRCLIIADGFYEWSAHPGARRRRPFHITRADGAPFAFAGLWAIAHRQDGTPLYSCTILTRPANDAVRPLHDRMPVILHPGEEAAWLDLMTAPDDLRRILRGLEAGQTALREVSPVVNDARHDAPDCLAPPAPDPQPTLF